MPLARVPMWVTAVAILVGGFRSLSGADAACLPPTLSAPFVDESGDVEVSWQLRDCLPETLKTYTGAIRRGFYPGGSYAVQGVAVRLDDFNAGDVVNRLKANFLAREGTSQSDWSLMAEFAWTLNYDSTGYPGSLAAPPRYWPLGKHDSLRGSGWYEDRPGWLIPSTASGALWLVGIWPGRSAEVVRLSTDELPLTRPVMIGFGNQGFEQWITVASIGLFVEIEVTPDPSAIQSDVRLISDYGSNALSRVLRDSLISTGCAGALLDSRITAAEAARYGVITVCDTTNSDTVWTSFVTPPTLWTVTPDPGEVFILVPQSGRTQSSVMLTSGSPVQLKLTVNEVFLNAEEKKSSNLFDVPKLSATLPVDVLPASGSARLEVEVESSQAPPGSYFGGVSVTVSDPSSGRGFRLGIPVQVVVDQQTSVIGDDASGELPARDAWQLRADPNPFVRGTQISIIWNRPLIPMPQAPSIGSERQAEPIAELTVYNVLGQLLLRRRHYLPGTVAGEASLRIDGTESWAAGVYFGRVEIAGTSRVIKLLRVR